jgi:hypothetical protein
MADSPVPSYTLCRGGLGRHSEYPELEAPYAREPPSYWNALSHGKRKLSVFISLNPRAGLYHDRGTYYRHRVE